MPKPRQATLQEYSRLIVETADLAEKVELAKSAARAWHLRLERARSLLLQTSMSAMEVALACGFVSASHFAKTYREHFGRTPKEDRGLSASR